MNELSLAAEKAMKQCLRLREGENFLLITDTEKTEIAEALAYWAKEVGAETTTYLMTESLRPITEPASLFKEMAARAEAIAYVLEARIGEKAFRTYMVKVGRAQNRICMMPGLTRETMERLVNIDFEEMNAFTTKVISALQDAEDVVLEHAEGTRIEPSVKGRKWENDNGDISCKGMFGNLPAGECRTAPVEESFTGRLVISLVDDKLGHGVMQFEKGKLAGFSGKGIEEIVRNIGDDETGGIIGELDVGTNPHPGTTANMLEARKGIGTAHFAFGDAYGLSKNESDHHYDALVDRVTIRANGEYIARDGKFLS